MRFTPKTRNGTVITRAGCVVIALRGELDVCTAAGVVSALTALAAAGARIIVDLADWPTWTATP